MKLTFEKNKKKHSFYGLDPKGLIYQNNNENKHDQPKKCKKKII